MRRQRLLALLALFFLVIVTASCDEPQPVAVPLGNQSAAAGQSLAGLYWEPPHDLSPAVLLLPMLGHGKEDWIPLATQLRQQGYGVLALDLREQGRTGPQELTADTGAGFAFLRRQKKVDAARIGIVGASIGANAALRYAAEEPMVRLVVLLSPGQNYRGVATEPAMRDYGARPLLLLASEEDLSSAPAVHRLAAVAQGETISKLYPGSAHGTDLLASGAGASDQILSFLRAHL